MSAFVKGMNMPRSCWECNLHCFRDNEKIKWGPITIIPEDFRCGGNNGWHETNEFDFLNERHPDCPLVDVPTPHGRLIDADAYIDKHEECGWLDDITVDEFNAITPTIIEAEVGDNA